MLVRVERDQAYADRALDATLQRSHADGREKALATELVYGTLRHRIHIDHLLEPWLKRPLSKAQIEVRNALRLGAYQLLHTRIPTHAAVHESVSLLSGRNRSASGFVNALLRKVAAALEADQLPNFDDRDRLSRLAIVGSHPRWLLAELDERLGATELEAFIEANNHPPRLMLRVNPMVTDRAQLREALSQRGLSTTIDGAPTSGLIVDGAGAITQTPEFIDGLFSVQDFAAQLVSTLAPVRPRDVILDACAAPGGKTCHLAERSADQARVLAVDRHRGRTRLITGNAKRLGLNSVETAVVDAADPNALRETLVHRGFERVDIALVDAPCSGLGTLKRHPELRASDAKDIAELAAIQRRLLESVATSVRDGGHLVYSVCTVTEAESTAVLDAFLNTHSEFRVTYPDSPELREYRSEESGRSVFRSWPHRHGCDGFFAVCLRRGGA